MINLRFYLLLAGAALGGYALAYLGLWTYRTVTSGYAIWAAEQRDIEAWRLRVARRRMREVDDAMRQRGRR
jgi:hypothetical protein